MADKYNVVEPKVPIGIIASIATTIIILVVLIIVAIPSNKEKIYADYMATANEYFTKDHPFYEIDAKQVEKFADNDDTFLLFISSSDNQSSQAHIGTFEKYFQAEDYIAEVDGVKISDLFDTIYYLSPLHDAEGFATLSEDYALITETTPQFVLFVDGEILETFNADLSSTEQNRNTNVREFYEDIIAILEEQE